MSTNGLQPHAYTVPAVHPRHPEWLHHFTPHERRMLIEEDATARSRVFLLMAGIWSLGLVTLAMAFWSM